MENRRKKLKILRINQKIQNIINRSFRERKHIKQNYLKNNNMRKRFKIVPE